MADAETEPRSLLVAVTPTPVPKSTLLYNIPDPLLTLTPEKTARPIHTLPQGRGRVERHGPTDGLSITHACNIAIDGGAHNMAIKLKKTSKQNGKHTTEHELSKIPSKTTTQTMQKKRNCSRNSGQLTGQNLLHGVPCNLTLPQCHSTAIVGHHLDTLQTQQFDSDNAVLKVLQESQEVRTAFAIKVAEGVNRPVEERKYSGLIALDVPVAETIAQATGDKITKVRSAPSKTITKVSESSVPDILDLFTPDMIMEQPNFDMPSLRQQEVKLEKAPANMTFNLYKHIRCWESS